MPDPLDPRTLDALAHEGDDDRKELGVPLYWRISDVRRRLREDKDWGMGIVQLMIEGVGVLADIQRGENVIGRDARNGSDDWIVTFAVRAIHPLSSATADLPFSTTLRFGT